ncbi:MAG: DUF4338 domain-containing protein, partial [Boseongicola sp. SB0667_bin_21]|nr:DUF4338 domain-containing protein [Boseongicola sp. SB0667_bin_21]
PRFTGAVYKASGWIRVGTNLGRGKHDRKNECAKPRKDIWLCPDMARAGWAFAAMPAWSSSQRTVPACSRAFQTPRTLSTPCPAIPTCRRPWRRGLGARPRSRIACSRLATRWRTRSSGTRLTSPVPRPSLPRLVEPLDHHSRGVFLLRRYR